MSGRPWTEVDLAQLEELYPHMRTDRLADLLERSTCSVYGMAGKLDLSKSEEYLASPDACRLRREENPGIAYRYPKGHVPANKGLRRPGWAPGRMRETQFKRGQVPRNYMPVGSTRLIEGYLYVKVAEVPHSPYTVNWKPVHHLVWERANGRPIPPRHVLRFSDGNRHNFELENLELLTLEQNGARAQLHAWPKPLKAAIQIRGALNRRINRMEKDRAEHA